jgi:hypothetical protein
MTLFVTKIPEIGRGGSEPRWRRMGTDYRGEERFEQKVVVGLGGMAEGPGAKDAKEKRAAT